MKKIIGFDTETHLVQPGILAPKMVCLSFADWTGRSGVKTARDGISFIREALLDDSIILGGHRVMYDLAVVAREEPNLLPLIFKAIERGRIFCTMIRQRLIDIATGEYGYYKDKNGLKVKNLFSLQQFVSRYFNKSINKGLESWQLKFAQLDGLPVSAWPKEAEEYALWDSIYARDVYLEQEKIAEGPIPTELEQTKAAWGLHLMSVWGVRANAAQVERIKNELVIKKAELEKVLKQSGIVRPDGSKNQLLIRDLVKKAYENAGMEPPLTDGGNISTDREAILNINDPALNPISEFIHVDKMLGTYMPPLFIGSKVPFNPNYNILVRSGRTSCGSGDEDNESVGNIQNQPRDSRIRACWEAREGYVFCTTDYEIAELRSLAQMCLDFVGYSVLADELKSGRDPHVALGAEWAGMAYEEGVARYTSGDKEFKKWRDRAKAVNFGLPGGLGAQRLTGYVRGYGVEMDLRDAQKAIAGWKKHYPEMNGFFRHTKMYMNENQVQHPRTGFVRGDLTFTSLANHWFQDVTAFGAKKAIWEISKECYLGESSDGEYDGKKKVSPLLGVRAGLFIHDEIISEIPLNKGKNGVTAAAFRQAEVMSKAMNQYVTDIPNPCVPALMYNWDKNAKTIKDAEGNLEVWTPK